MIPNNLQNLKDTIHDVALDCGRKPEDIRLVAVSKRFPITAMQDAIQAGHFLFGENYIQEAQEKMESLDDSVQIHFIGHLQSNKAKIAANLFSMVETVDSTRLALALQRHLENLDKHLDILIQVNIGREGNKSGVLPENTEELMQQIMPLPRLRIKGLMTMPPWSSKPESSRHYFSELRKIAQTLRNKQLFHDNNSVELSMGMSNDFHIAIEEGATLIRIGTSIFGNRP